MARLNPRRKLTITGTDATPSTITPSQSSSGDMQLRPDESQKPAAEDALPSK